MGTQSGTARRAFGGVGIAAALLISACGPPAEPSTPGAGPGTGAALTSGTALERLFPLQDRHVYQYVAETDSGEQEDLVARVSRSEAGGGTLQLPGGRKQFRYQPDGVVLTRPTGAPVYVLKQPLTPGTSWRGEHGGTVEIVAVDASVTVPAGVFTGCVTTVEQRGGDRPLRVATTFCPDVGIVQLEATSGAQLERASLKSYGPPVDIGPDGVRRLP
ncbi:MAG: hypothetical protein JRI68_09165 [Deltaproteobacteria bacterium]|nr:hypothetical protein [Deltaproteobacteria bacterium]